VDADHARHDPEAWRRRVQLVRDVLVFVEARHEPRPRPSSSTRSATLRDRLANQLVIGPAKKTREQWGEVDEVLASSCRSAR
jgi:hypothetical protein